MSILEYLQTSFDGNTTVTYNGNKARESGGVYSVENSSIKFDGDSKVTLTLYYSDMELKMEGLFTLLQIVASHLMET